MSSDHKLELENQFILRLPEDQAKALSQALKSGEPLANRLFVKFENDIRNGYVRFDDTTLPARLYDLPTIIESYKTLDRKNFYKTADISQILICKEIKDTDKEPKPNPLEEVDEDTRKSRYEALFEKIGGKGKREFLFPHGITPPLKNVRKKRFRKTLKKKYVDFSEIEKEVKRLFKFDCEAIDSRYEIVEENKIDTVQPTTFSTEDPASPMSCGGPAGMQSTDSQNIDIELFGCEVSSSDESSDRGDDDDDDDADDIEEQQENDDDMDQDDNIDFEDDESQQPQTSESTTAMAADIAAEVAAASDLICQNDDNEEKRLMLNEELLKIREKIENEESTMMGLENQGLRARFQDVLNKYYEKENELKKQLEDLSKRM